MLYIGFSGGKDSTAMVLRLAELGEDFECIFTPTGDELPDLVDHIEGIVKMVGCKLNVPKGPQLEDLIDGYNALPNWRQRWCTRQIKIEPCLAFLKEHPGSTLAVALRADEEDRQGIYTDLATYRRPLHEWGWGLKEVLDYLKSKNVSVPKRTDCGCCYGQRLNEWWTLWREYPDRWSKYEAWEERTGHTFRSPQRDTWPAALKDLRREFESGRVPRGATNQLNLFAEDCETMDPGKLPCRVCRL